MRFKVYAKEGLGKELQEENLKQIKEALDDFARMCREETEKDKRVGMVSSLMEKVGLPKLVFVYQVEERGTFIELIVRASVMQKGRGRMAGKMAKKVVGYLKKLGVEYQRVVGLN